MLSPRTFALASVALLTALAWPAQATVVNHEPFELHLGTWTSHGVVRTTSVLAHTGAGVARSGGAGAHASTDLPPMLAGVFSIWVYDDLSGCALAPLPSGEKVQFALIGDGTVGASLGVGINTIEGPDCTYTLRHNGVETPTLLPRIAGWSEWRITWDATARIAVVSVDGVPLTALPYAYVVEEASFGNFWSLASTPTDYDDALIVAA